jgi:hypothetical protein
MFSPLVYRYDWEPCLSAKKIIFKIVGGKIGENIQAKTISDHRTATTDRTYLAGGACRTQESVAFSKGTITNIRQGLPVDIAERHILGQYNKVLFYDRFRAIMSVHFGGILGLIP